MGIRSGFFFSGLNHIFYCATVPSLLRTIGPMIIAMTILHRSAGMKGMTQTASAAPTVYPDWKQNHAVPNA